MLCNLQKDVSISLFWRSLLLVIGSIFLLIYFVSQSLSLLLYKCVVFCIPASCFPVSLPFTPSTWSAHPTLSYFLSSGYSSHCSEPPPKLTAAALRCPHLSPFFLLLLSRALQPCHSWHPYLVLCFLVINTFKNLLCYRGGVTYLSRCHMLELNPAPCDTSNLCLFGDGWMWLAFLPISLFLVKTGSRRLWKYFGP